MKKIKTIIALIVAITILALTLSSCSSLLDNLAQDPTEPPTETPSESSDPTDSNDKPPRGTLECFTVFPEGEYLEERFRTSEPLPGFDFVDTFRGDHGNGTPTSCSNETTYYYMAENAYRGFKMLYYMDKATGTSAPLCGKPECLHTDSTCNGYIGDRGYGLSLYDGRIWWISLGIGAEVHSCALDGTDHRDELKISRDLVGTSGVPDVYFHRGVMYWAKQEAMIVDGEIRSHEEIISFPLDGGDPYVIYQADHAGDSGYPQVYPLRDKLLIIFDRTITDYNEDYSIAAWRPAIGIYLFDLNTRQVETLFSGETDFSYGGRAVLLEDGIYITHASLISDDGAWVPCSRFLPWGGEDFEPIEFQDWYAYNFDGRFITIHLSDDKLSVTERALDGTLILDRSFPVNYTGNQFLLGIDGWDEDFYYIRLPSVRVAVATDAHALYYLAGTEKE